MLLLSKFLFHLRGSDEKKVLSNGIIGEEAVHLQQRRLNHLQSAFETIIEFEIERQLRILFCCHVWHVSCVTTHTIDKMAMRM